MTDTRGSTATLAPPEEEVHEPETSVEGGDHGAHIHLPPNSLWPITMAFGITVMASGLVFNLFVSLPGLFLFVWAIYGWIQELMASEH